MSEKINIEIRAEDKASDTINRVNKALGTAFKAGMIGAAAGAAALAGGLALCVKEAMAAEESNAQLNAVLESTGGAAGVTADMANDLATNLSQVTKYEDDAIIAGESMLLTFTNIGKDVFPDATQAILDMSTATGQDLQGSAVQLGKALNDPIAGISALSRVGVTFTEEQKAVIQSLVETGDVAGAQKIILAELNKEFGGSAVAAGSTLSGQLTILKNTLGNVAEGIGTALLPVISELLNTYIVPLIPKIQEWADKFAQQIVPAIQSTIGVITAVVNFIRDNWIPIMAAVVSGLLVAVFTVILPAFIAWATAAWATAAATIAAMAPIIIPIVAIGAAVALLAAAWENNWFGIRDKLTAVWNILEPIFSAVKDWLATQLTAAIQSLSNFWTNTLLPAITTAYNFFNENILPIIQSVIDILTTLGEITLTALAGFWQNVLLPAITTAYDFFNDKILPVLNDVWDFISTNLSPVVSGLASIFQGLADTLSGAVKGALDWISGALADLASFLDGFTLPDWLTPGSPTPFELGLRGIADAMKEVERSSATFGINFQGQPGALARAGQAGTTNNYTLNYQGNRSQEDVVVDFGLLKARTRT